VNTTETRCIGVHARQADRAPNQSPQRPDGNMSVRSTLASVQGLSSRYRGRSNVCPGEIGSWGNRWLSG
jgi:hypothetical protein